MKIPLRRIFSTLLISCLVFDEGRPAVAILQISCPVSQSPNRLQCEALTGESIMAFAHESLLTVGPRFRLRQLLNKTWRYLLAVPESTWDKVLGTALLG